jgi:dTDP-4-dehydrorhamnose reductase
LKSRGVKLAVKTITPIATADFPTKAERPANSRLDLSRLRDRFGVTTPTWQEALSPELHSFVARQRELAVSEPTVRRQNPNGSSRAVGGRL